MARSKALAAAPAVLFVVAAFAWPFARLSSTSGSGIVRLFADRYDRRALFDSIALAVVVAMASTVLCLVPAWMIARRRFVGRALVRASFAVPLSLSGIVVGFLTIAMLGNAGALPTLLHAEWLRGSAYGLTGLVLAYLYFEIPRATLTLESALAGIDEAVLGAARTLGATRSQVVLWVLWPSCAPAVRAAMGVTFAAALGSLGAALILAARFPLLPVELYRAFTGTLDDSLAAAMAVVLAIVAAVGLLMGRRR